MSEIKAGIWLITIASLKDNKIQTSFNSKFSDFNQVIIAVQRDEKNLVGLKQKFSEKEKQFLKKWNVINFFQC